MRVGVTGAAGVVGAQVVRGLVAAGAEAVVAMVRDPRRVAVHPAVTAVQVDYADERRMLDAMTGVDVLVFVGSDGPADAVLWHHHVVVSAAVRREVRRVVVLSSQDARADSPFCYARVYARTEAWAHGLPEVVVVRAGLYAEFFARFLRDRPDPASLRLPMGGRGVAPVTRADVADCLVAAALGASGTGRGRSRVRGPTGFPTWPRSPAGRRAGPSSRGSARRRSSAVTCSGPPPTPGGTTRSSPCSRPSPRGRSRPSPRTCTRSPGGPPPRSPGRDGRGTRVRVTAGGTRVRLSAAGRGHIGDGAAVVRVPPTPRPTENPMSNVTTTVRATRPRGLPRARTIAYWLVSLPVLAETAVGIQWDLARTDYVLDVLDRLGYPAYVATILGVAKILALIALLVPRFPRLKEWAYAGIFFVYAVAALSHVAIEDVAGNILTPAVLAAITLASWALRPPSRRDPAPLGTVRRPGDR